VIGVSQPYFPKIIAKIFVAQSFFDLPHRSPTSCIDHPGKKKREVIGLRPTVSHVPNSPEPRELEDRLDQFGQVVLFLYVSFLNGNNLEIFKVF
jgi:hypothetical protein